MFRPLVSDAQPRYLVSAPSPAVLIGLLMRPLCEGAATKQAAQVLDPALPSVSPL